MSEAIPVPVPEAVKTIIGEYLAENADNLPDWRKEAIARVLGPTCTALDTFNANAREILPKLKPKKPDLSI